MKFLGESAVAVAVLVLLPAVCEGQSHEELDLNTVLPELDQNVARTADVSLAAKLIVEQTNEFRGEHDLAALQVDERLTSAAQDFAEYMASALEYGHTANGQRPSQRASEKGYDYCIVAENIAYAFSSQGYLAEPLAERFVSGWQQSPEHRRNMLDPDVVETGVAVAQRKETGVYFAVQMFGRPKSQRVEFQIVNRAGQEITYEVGQRSFDLPPRVTMTHGRCRPVDVTFHWPAQDEPATTTRKATSGNALVVERGDDGGFQVKQQAMDK